MPDFAGAEISNQSRDLTPYVTFLKRLTSGQVVSLPLELGESARAVMRSLNAAASEANIRLARLASDEGFVRFRVLAPEKRTITMSETAKRERVEKARATREVRRQVSAMGLDGLTADPTGHQGDQPLDAAPPVQDVIASAVGPVDETREADPTEPSKQPATSQIEVPVETDQAHPGEALGEPLTEDPVTHEFVPPEQLVREPDAGGAPAKRAPRPRRSARAAGDRNGAESP
jgi:hypothetical protein